MEIKVAIEEMKKEFDDLSLFAKQSAEECHQEWRLTDAQTLITQYLHYKNFSSKLAYLLEINK